MKKYTFNDYYKKLKSGLFQTAIKLSWLNADETVQFEFTNFIYNMTGSLNVNYQNGARRSCSIEIESNDNKFPINYEHIWLGQKFQLWMGIYMDELQQEPYYFSQGIFYIKNPKEVFNPQTRKITLQGVDKWAYLDGTLFGALNSNYKLLINKDLREVIKETLIMSKEDFRATTQNPNKMLDPKEPLISNEYDLLVDDEMLQYYYDENYGNCLIYNNSMATNANQQFFITYLKNGQRVIRYLNNADDVKIGNYILSSAGEVVDSTTISSILSTAEPFKKAQLLIKNPYTLTIDYSKTYADIILEIATRLRANVYYNEDGRLTFTPYDLNMSTYSNYDKPIAWNFNLSEQEFLGLDLEHKFDCVYNIVTVYGKITNGYQAKARVGNLNSHSDTSVDKIGRKEKPPYKDDNYQSNQQCLELAEYYAKTDMIMNVTGTIQSLPLYHIDVDQIVTVNTNGQSIGEKYKYLITGYSLPINPIGQMSLSVTNMKLFQGWVNLTEELEEGETK